MEHTEHQPDTGGRTPRQRRRSVVLGWAAVVVSIVLVGTALTAYAAYRDVFGQIRQVKVTGLGQRPRTFDNSMNILVIGSDTRKGKNARFGKHIGGQRSDTVLVLHLSPGFRRAVVLSLPRDSVVPVLYCPKVPGWPGQATQSGQIEQVNATFADGGPGCLWKTIEHTTHIRLDHFAELNFTGFENVINDLGGVSICLPYAIHDPRSKLRLSRGIHHVMGAQALAYWRVRYIGVGSDLERIQRDQYLMASVAQKVKRTNLLGSPGRLFKVIRDIASSLTTDSGLTQSGMISLVQSLRTMPLRAVHFVQAPVGTYQPNPNWVQWSPQAARLFRAIARDHKLPRTRNDHGDRSRSRSRLLGSASPTPSPSAGTTGGTPARAGRSRPALAGVNQRYGGITAGANVCHDAGAFTGPLGGH
ncbi:MAG: LCP family protein [Streptosporangiaceae bacterium]